MINMEDMQYEMSEYRKLKEVQEQERRGFIQAFVDEYSRRYGPVQVCIRTTKIVNGKEKLNEN